MALKYELSPQALMNHTAEKLQTFPMQKGPHRHPCKIIADYSLLAASLSLFLAPSASPVQGQMLDQTGPAPSRGLCTL